MAGEDWSDEENAQCAAAYFDHLRLDLRGTSFNKSQLYRELSQKIGRTPKSIEFKFQNISAVLDEIGLEWINGLAPLRNYQQSLSSAISNFVPDIIEFNTTNSSLELQELAGLYLEAPPERSGKVRELPAFIRKLVQQFDPIERDRQNKVLGDAGEEFAFQFEKRQLEGFGRVDLAKKIRWVSKEDGDGAGYDISSFQADGREKFIEVKTTVGGNRTPFYISRNETEFSREAGDRFNLFRLYNFRRAPKAFEMVGAVDKFVRLTAEQFRADFEA
jgi:hypothetical protein